MNKFYKIHWLIGMIVCCQHAFAVQVCSLESEIPSSTPDTRFVDNGNGTITDVGTGLMWLKCPLGVTGLNCEVGLPSNHTWQQALSEASLAFNADYFDWRLPNIKELQSIVEQRCVNPSINKNYFPYSPNLASINIWTSTPSVENQNQSWVLSFNFGLTEISNRNLPLNVRLVR